MKYSKADSVVDVDIQRGGQYGESSLLVSVSNVTGQQGCPDPDKVFVRFYRNPFASDTTGSGVGLYLVRELTKLLKGFVRYSYSADTNRVSFVVELPELSECPESVNPYA